MRKLIKMSEVSLTIAYEDYFIQVNSLNDDVVLVKCSCDDGSVFENVEETEVVHNFSSFRKKLASIGEFKNELHINFEDDTTIILHKKKDLIIENLRDEIAELRKQIAALRKDSKKSKEKDNILLQIIPFPHTATQQKEFMISAQFSK